MKRWIAWALLIGAALLAAYALFGTATDEEKILAALGRLEDGVALTQDQTNPIVRTAHVNSHFKEVFTKDVRFSIPELTSAPRGRAELSRLAVQAGQVYSTIDVNFEDTDVSLRSDTAAEVRARVKLLAVGDGPPRRDRRRVRLEFVQQEGEWLIDFVQVLEQD